MPLERCLAVNLPAAPMAAPMTAPAARSGELAEPGRQTGWVVYTWPSSLASWSSGLHILLAWSWCHRRAAADDEVLVVISPNRPKTAPIFAQ